MPTNQSFPYPHTPTYLSFPYPQMQHQPYEMADVALCVNLRPYEPETGGKCLSTAHEIVIRSDDFTLEWLTKTCIALDVLKQGEIIGEDDWRTIVWFDRPAYTLLVIRW